MTTVELTNTNPFFPLKVFTQDRSRNVTDKPTAAAAPKRETRAELEKIGSEMRDVPTRVSTKFGSETRNVPTPFYRTAGYETLNEFVTEQGEKQLRESQKAIAPAPCVQHVVDKWNSLSPLQTVQPGAKAYVPISEEKRLVIECESEVGLQIANESKLRTLRLRNRDMQSGLTVHVSFIPPAREYPQAGLVVAHGKVGAIVELMPS